LCRRRFLDLTQGWFAPASVGVCVLTKLQALRVAGALTVLVSLLSGCNDPGSGTASTSAPQEANSGSSATLSWEAPTTNTNGTPLMDLAGYRIYYGSSATDLSQSAEITSVGIQTYVIDDLGPGTWYFAIMAVTSTGAESALSNIVAKTIT
jgi:Fibronectin type III domain